MAPKELRQKPPPAKVIPVACMSCSIMGAAIVAPTDACRNSRHALMAGEDYATRANEPRGIHDPVGNMSYTGNRTSYIDNL
jgi:hypothetical protein